MWCTMLCHNVIIFGGPEYILEQANKQCFNWWCCCYPRRWRCSSRRWGSWRPRWWCPGHPHRHLHAVFQDVKVSVISYKLNSLIFVLVFVLKPVYSTQKGLSWLLSRAYFGLLSVRVAYVYIYIYPIFEKGSTVLLLLKLLLCYCECLAQGTTPGFWNGVDWRALVED